MERKEDVPRIESGDNIKIDLEFERVNIKKRRYPFFILAVLVMLALLLFFAWKGEVNGDEASDALAEGEELESQWQGAFSSREVFDACRAASVSVFVGEERCSGFVYSSDGWIATAGGVVNEDIRGRIEVLLCDGRRFFADSFRINRESGIALMKIEADGLVSARIDKGIEVCSGEEIFTFCDTLGDGESSLLSGRIAHTDRTVGISNCGIERSASVMQLSILLMEEGVGAPVFNSQGFLVGVGCASDTDREDERYTVGYAFFSTDLDGAFHAMREGKAVEDDVILNFIYN